MNNTRDQLYINYLKTKEKLTLYEVAICLDRSLQTINNWYKWKRENPNNKWAKMLPDYMQAGERQERFWRGKDIKALIKFRDNVPWGVLSDVTQRYVKRENLDGLDNTIK